MNNNIVHTKSWKLFCIYYFIVAIYSLVGSPFWHLEELYMPFAIFGISTLFYVFHNNWFRVQYRSVAIWAIVALLLGTVGNVNGYIVAFLRMLPFLFFLLLEDGLKMALYEFIRKWLAILLGFSIIFWIPQIMGKPLLPGFPDYYGAWSEKFGDFGYIFENHFLYVVNLRRLHDYVLRFSSIFLEPGYLGCFLSTILFVEEFKIKKWYNLIFLIALILTFSLAGWLVFGVGIFLLQMMNSSNRVFKLLLLFASLCLFDYVFSTLNGGDNVVNEFILERMKYDSSTGTIEGYNRTEEAFDEWFRGFLFTSDVLFGNPTQYQTLWSDSVNVGWKYYVACNGFVGLLAYILYLLSVVRVNGSKYLGFSMMILMILIFSRGQFFNFSSLFMIIYFVGIYKLTNNEIIQYEQ